MRNEDDGFPGLDGALLGGRLPYACAFCGEPNDVFIDRTAGRRQIFTEDCQVCCRPNLLTVTLDPEGGVDLHVAREYDA